MGIGKLFIELSMEGEVPYCDAVVSFYEYHENDKKDLKWMLRGRFDGFASNVDKTVGYVTIPISGYETRLYEGERVGEVHTLRHEAQDKKRLRAVWQYLQTKGFEVVDIEEEETITEETV